MNYDFFADKTDKVRLLEYILSETDLRIFDSYSKYGQPVREYKSVWNIEHEFDLDNGEQFAVTFVLWSPRFSDKVTFRRIALDPRRCEGNTFRYTTSGLGLIQLYFGGIVQQILNYSHMGHQSEKRAIAWEETLEDGDQARLWNWREISSTARKLKSLIHQKWAVDKIGSAGILPGAKELQSKGFLMGYFEQ